MKKRMDRRSCTRFRIPGATLKHRKTGVLFLRGSGTTVTLPLLDISRGGLSFPSDDKIKKNTPLTLIVNMPGDPGDAEPLEVKGVVKWLSVNPSISYKFRVGVQFLPYGDGRGCNPGHVLEKIKLIEGIYGDG